MSEKPKREAVKAAVDFALKKQAEEKIKKASSAKIQIEEESEASKDLAWQNYERETAMQIGILIRR